MAKSGPQKRGSVELRGSVIKLRQGTSGGWGQNGWKAVHVKRGDLCGEESRTGVRALVVVMKRL